MREIAGVEYTVFFGKIQAILYQSLSFEIVNFSMGRSAAFVALCIPLAFASYPSKALNLLRTETNALETSANEQSPSEPRAQASDGLPTTPAQWNKFMNAHRQSAMISSAIWASLLSLIAYYWRNTRIPKVPDASKQSDADEFKDFKYGLFGCFDDLNYCICGACCPAIRWAETISYVPRQLAFWGAFAMFVGLQFGSQVVTYFVGSGSGFIAVVFLCTLVYFRQQLRKQFDMEHGTPKTCCLDCFTYFCCGCCAIIQEARHVEDAVQCGRLQEQ